MKPTSAFRWRGCANMPSRSRCCKGENSEKHSLRERFAAIIGNYFQIVAVRKNLIGFTSSYGQLSPIIPYIVAAPFYFAGKITLGVMTQTARAFGSVNEALTFFVNYYVSLADFKAVLDRLTSFDSSIEAAHAPAGLAAAPAATTPDAGEHIGLDAVTRAPAGRPRHRQGRDIAPRAAGVHAHHRPVRRGKIDPAARDLRHLAFRRRRRHKTGRREGDAAAAKALYPDRDPARRGDLSERAGKL